MKRKRPTHEAMDAGSPQMARHFSIVPKLSDPTTMTMKNIDGDEVDRMLLVDAITAVQHGTLRSFEKKLLSFGFNGLRSPDYSSRIFADPSEVSEKKAAAVVGAVALFKKIDAHPHIGKHRRKKLVNMVLLDAPWGKLRHQIEELRTVCHALDYIFSGRR